MRAFFVTALLIWSTAVYAYRPPAAAPAQTTSSCDAVCQALIATPGYQFVPAAAPIVAGELQGIAALSAVSNAQLALEQSAITTLQTQVAADEKEIALYKLYLSELCQRIVPPLQIPGTTTPCAIQ